MDDGLRSLPEYLEVLVGLLTISAVPVIMPIFIGLTIDRTSTQRFRSAFLAALTLFVTLALAIYLGEQLLSLLSISLFSFRVAGGILIFATGLGLISAKSELNVNSIQGVDKSEIGIVPLGIPLLAGPGMISVVLIQSQEMESNADNLVLVGLVLLVAFFVWACLAASEMISKMMGPNGLEILSKVSGLILAALGVEFIATGTLQLFPGLAG
jgi:multiple antibiotic resistance protein